METQSQPQESLEQRPIVGQEVAPEIIEEQPLEDSQPLEAVNQPQGSPEQQPLETLESSQPIEDLPVEASVRKHNHHHQKYNLLINSHWKL